MLFLDRFWLYPRISYNICIFIKAVLNLEYCLLFRQMSITIKYPYSLSCIIHFLDTSMQEQFMSKFMVIILEVLKASEDVVAQEKLLHVFQILADNG